MKLHYITIAGILGMYLLCSSCTERRTFSDPVADGDTVEVVIPVDSDSVN